MAALTWRGHLILAIVLVAGCTGSPAASDGDSSAAPPASSTMNAAVDPDVVGTWLATTGDPAGVTAVFSEEGTFTWSNGDLSGTYQADGTTLTFQFSADGAFCPGGTLIWEYAVTNDQLTSDVVGGQCGGEQGPPSPDWIFERQ